MDVKVNGVPYRLVHAAPIELYSERNGRYYSQAHCAVWRRLARHDPIPLNETVIFGHTPTENYRMKNPMAIYHGINRLGIDCGGGYPEAQEEYWPQGRLACLRLDDMKEFYSDESIEGDDENA